MNQPWVPDAPPAPPQTPDVVHRLLDHYGAATRVMLQQQLRQPDPAPYLDALVAEYPSRPGKMMRPAICIATACAFGGQMQAALPLAAGIELFHNALLIHDDIEDESDERRGRPTLHALHGVALALNAGDATMLASLGILGDALAALPAARARLIVEQSVRMARQTAEGQALELGWRTDATAGVTQADYLVMVLKKTAWMSLIWPLQVGAISASHSRPDLDALARFGFFLGAAFQIQDDLLNLVGGARYGKERLGDLYEGKRTLMAIHIAGHADPAVCALARRWLQAARAERCRSMVEDIHALMEHTGAIEQARAVAGGMAGAAALEYERLAAPLAPSPDRAFLAGLVPWVFERT